MPFWYDPYIPFGIFCDFALNMFKRNFGFYGGNEKCRKI